MFSSMFIILSHTHNIIVFVALNYVTFCLVNNILSFACIYILVLVISLYFITRTHTYMSAIFVVEYTFQETRVFDLKHTTSIARNKLHL